MTDLKETLEQFRKLDAGKTNGKWNQSHRPTPPDGLYNTQIYDSNGETIATLEWCGEYQGNGVTTSLRGNNAAFIAYAANNALPALEQAMAEIERHKQTIESMSGLLGLIRLELSTADGWEDGETFYKSAVENIREALSETTE